MQIRQQKPTTTGVEIAQRFKSKQAAKLYLCAFDYLNPSAVGGTVRVCVCFPIRHITMMFAFIPCVVVGS